MKNKLYDNELLRKVSVNWENDALSITIYY